MKREINRLKVVLAEKKRTNRWFVVSTFLRGLVWEHT